MPTRNKSPEIIIIVPPPPVGEAGFSIERRCTYVHVCMCVRVYVTTLQRCGGIRAVQSLLLYTGMKRWKWSPRPRSPLRESSPHLQPMEPGKIRRRYALSSIKKKPQQFARKWWRIVQSSL